MLPPAAPRCDPQGGTGQRGWMGKVHIFPNKKREESGTVGMVGGKAGQVWLSPAVLSSRSVRDGDIKATKDQRGPGVLGRSLLPQVFIPSFLWHPFPGAKPSQESAGPRWCLGGLDSARAALIPSSHWLTPHPPPALSRHTDLSCPIRLGPLSSEPDKEATGQGRDRDKDAEQEWQKEGGEGVEPQRKKSLVERSVLSDHRLSGHSYHLH